MTRIKTEIIWVVNCILISGFVSPALALDGFTQADCERLVRVFCPTSDNLPGVG